MNARRSSAIAVVVGLAVSIGSAGCGDSETVIEGPDRSATSTRAAATTGAAAAAATSATPKCVFRAPFKEWACVEQAVWHTSTKYSLFNDDYIGADAACTPQEPARDTKNRPGWRRVVCTVTIKADHGDLCALGEPGEKKFGPCTGTLWQYTPEGHVRDLGVPRFRFRVVLVQHPVWCVVVARITQVEPRAPKLQPSPP